MRSARLVAFLLTLSPCLAEDAPSQATLRHDLLHGDLSVRRKAAYALWQSGEAAKDSIPALAQALRDEDAYVRDTCVRVLQRFYGALAPGTPGFLEALGDERPEVRREAARMLGGLGSLPVPVPDDLLAGMRVALGDEDANVRAALCDALGRLGAAARGAAGAVRERVRDESPQVRSAAITALASLDGAGHSSTFVEALDDAEAAVRISATNALAALRVTEALDPLAAVLRADADPSVKAAAAGAIGAIGGPRAVTLLATSLESTNVALRAAAVHGVSYLGPEGARLGHLLVLASETQELRRAVCVAIAALGRAGRDAEPALIRILSDPDDEARRLAASVYPGLGRASPEGTKALAEALFDSDPWVRGYAATAVGQLADRSAMPALVRCYEQYGDDKTREAVVFAIGTLGAAARDELPFVRRVRDEESGVLRLRAALAAANVAGAGPDRDAAVAISVESLGSPELAQQAITNLATLGPAAAPAIPRLRAMLGGGWMESMPAAGALLRIEGTRAKDALGLLTRYQSEENLLAMSLLADWGTAEAAALLRQGLGSPSPLFRRACAAALGRIRPAAAETLAALRALIEERDWAVRTAAARALDELS